MSRSRFDPDLRDAGGRTAIDTAFARLVEFLQRCRAEHWLMFGAGLLIGAILF